MAKNISKSQYIKGKQCPLALWYYHYRKDLALEQDNFTQKLFDAGNAIGEMAKSYFPKGIEVTNPYYDTTAAEVTTKAYIADGHNVIFEATAISKTDGNYARIDILRKAKGKDAWDLIEVKNSTEVKDYHLDDIAFQYYVFTRAGYKINKCFIMFVNNQYVKKGNVDPQKFFIMQDVSDLASSKENEVLEISSQLHYVLERKNEPQIDISCHCNEPFDCAYKHHCWKNVPEYSVYNIYKKDKVDDIIKQIKGYDIAKIPEDLYPNDAKAIDVKCYKNNRTHKDKVAIKNFLKLVKYPLYYLDYETIFPVIPVFDGTKPYQQVPFQFSLHIQNKKNGKLEHYEFIHQDETDPREAFVKQLIKVCGDKGSVVVYNQQFEMTRNKELALAFPQYAKQLEAINERMVDLLVPFRARALYSPKQHSSASIKAVLPAFTELSYAEMEIGNGGDASEQYLAFVLEMLSEPETVALFDNLAEYCKLDTLAMVKLMEVLRTAIE